LKHYVLKTIEILKIILFIKEIINILTEVSGIYYKKDAIIIYYDKLNIQQKIRDK